MARYQVILAYDGTEFFGFQRQVGGRPARTVQSEVEAALTKLGWQGEILLAAGRTDTGVHASGQVIAFDLAWGHAPETLLAALNANLPADVAAQAIAVADSSFHPRYNALARRYRYQIFCQSMRHPLRERYAWRVWPPVDPLRLQAAAALLPGTHDFAAFGTPPRTGGSTIRNVLSAGWQAAEDGGLTFEVVANAFLYHMVRRLVLLQVHIGQGRLEPQAIETLLHSSGPMVQGLAPPHGLALVEVLYPPGAAGGTGENDN